MKKGNIVLGIDLGMTNCCVALPRRNRPKDIEIIPDNKGRLIMPTVVGEDEKGHILVGYAAKRKTDLHPPPLFFIKRYMGTDMKFELQGREWMPEEISAEILKALRNQAEGYLKTEINHGVITIPGYFGIEQKLATKKAANLAGFNKVELLMEPIAIALGYGLQEREENLRILIYDLGAIALDVTVLEKRDNEFRILAFSGNSFLGGRDFDTALADFLLKKLKGDGYSIDLNPESEEDNRKFARLVEIAEEAKIALSEKNDTRIGKHSIFNDHDGQSIDINFTLKKSEFEELIRKKVDETIVHCKSTIQKAGLHIEEIDEVIMAGGGCYVPLIPQSIQEWFGKKPRFEAPEVCVVKGAALYAGLLTPLVPGLILYSYPTKTSEDTVVIGGKIEQEIVGKGNKPSESKIILSREEDKFEQISNLTENGDFIFEDVMLLKNTTNIFMLYLKGHAGNNLLCHSIKIIHHPDIEEEKETRIIPQLLNLPISIKFEEGVEVSVKEGTLLPQSFVFSVRTKDQSGKIDIPFFEGEHEIGKIVIKDLNPNLPTGTPIEITLELKEDYSIDAQGCLPITNTKALVEVITLPLHIPTIKELRRDFDETQKAFRQELEEREDSVLELQYKLQSKELIDEIQAAFSEIPTDIVKLSVLVSHLKNLLTQIKSIEVLKPSKYIFHNKISKALNLFEERAKQYEKVREEDFPQLISILNEQGDEAYKRKDKVHWEEANAQIDKVIENLYAAIPEPGLSSTELAPEFQQKLLSQIREIFLEAQKNKMGNKIFHEVGQLQNEILDIDTRTDPEKAIIDLKKIYDLKFTVLRDKITGMLKIDEDDR